MHGFSLFPPAPSSRRHAPCLQGHRKRALIALRLTPFQLVINALLQCDLAHRVQLSLSVTLGTVASLAAATLLVATTEVETGGSHECRHHEDEEYDGYEVHAFLWFGGWWLWGYGSLGMGWGYGLGVWGMVGGLGGWGYGVGGHWEDRFPACHNE